MRERLESIYLYEQFVEDILDSKGELDSLLQSAQEYLIMSGHVQSASQAREYCQDLLEQISIE